jgi:hypothetical protein
MRACLHWLLCMQCAGGIIASEELTPRSLRIPTTGRVHENIRRVHTHAELINTRHVDSHEYTTLLFIVLVTFVICVVAYATPKPWAFSTPHTPLHSIFLVR